MVLLWKQGAPGASPCTRSSSRAVQWLESTDADRHIPPPTTPPTHPPPSQSLQVLLEIQDTLRQPPHANKTMKTAVNVAVTAAFGFYISVACTGRCREAA